MATSTWQFESLCVGICFLMFQKVEAAAGLNQNANSFMLERKEFPLRGYYLVSALFSTTP